MGIHADGEAWLMSETLEMHSLRECEVRVKAVNGGNLVKYIDYKFSGGPLHEILAILRPAGLTR